MAEINSAESKKTELMIQKLSDKNAELAESNSKDGCDKQCRK